MIASKYILYALKLWINLKNVFYRNFLSMLKYSRDIKKFKSTADLKTLENAIQLKGLDFINSRMTFPVSNADSEPTFGNLSPESRKLLLQKVVDSKYLKQKLSVLRF